jgi:hypothetical protein
MGKKVEKKKLDEIRVRKLGKMGKKLGIKWEKNVYNITHQIKSIIK